MQQSSDRRRRYSELLLVASTLTSSGIIFIPERIVPFQFLALASLFIGLFGNIPLVSYHLFRTRKIASRWQSLRGVLGFGIWVPLINLPCLLLYILIGPWNPPQKDVKETERDGTANTTIHSGEHEQSEGDHDVARVDSRAEGLSDEQPGLTELQEEFVNGILPASAVAIHATKPAASTETASDFAFSADGPLPPRDATTNSCPWCEGSVENNTKSVLEHWNSDSCTRETATQDEAAFPIAGMADERTERRFQQLLENVRDLKSAIPERMPYRPLGSEGNHQKIRLKNINNACEDLEAALRILQSVAENQDEQYGLPPREDISRLQSQFSNVHELGATRIGEVVWDIYAEVLCKHATDLLQQHVQRSAEKEFQPIETAVASNSPQEGFDSLQSLSQQIETVGCTTPDSVQETAERLQTDLVASQISEIQPELDALLETAAPFYQTSEAEGYQQYLTAADYETLDESIGQVSEDVDTLKENIASRFQSQEVIQTVGHIEEEISLLEQQHGDRQGYNQTFVTKQTKACDDLFSDIGPEGISLNAAQRKAVVRNDVYNQVVAAAGTGKTMVLIIRIVYLIREQGVAPENILALAYTREASNEMETRLANQFNITDVTVQTLHAYARQLTVKKHGQSIEICDENDLPNIVREMVRDAPESTSPEFQSHLYEFLTRVDDPTPESANFETKEAYYEARKSQTYVTLRGEEVKSKAEKRIADFLFTRQVTYRYEDLAEWAETGDNYQNYRPDFYLPEYDIYIEHLGVDSAGEVPEWFSWSTDDYHEKVTWARDQFAAAEASLIETYEFEHIAGRLDEVLRGRLAAADVELDKLSLDSLIDRVYYENQQANRVQSALESFVENAKRFRLKPDDITAQLNKSNPRQYHFAKCGVRILQRYQQFLITNGLFDFPDVIHEATDYLEERSEPAKQHSRVLIDEFQDISVNQHAFVDSLTDPDTTKLFCVGDDWQSIYSFQGADVSRFIEFSKQDDVVRTDLTKNYRSPTSVVEAGNQLIEHNETYLKKTVESQTTFDTTPLLHQLDGHTQQAYTNRQGAYIARLVISYLEQGAELAEIMVLCRYDTAAPYLDAIKRELRERGVPFSGKSETFQPAGTTLHSAVDNSDTGAVSVYSIHQSKGREATHTILAHVAGGAHSFPSEQRDEVLLAPVRPISTDSLAEERRLFYVGITRTAGTLDLITRHGQHSRFLDEIASFTEMAWDEPTLATISQSAGRITIAGSVAKLDEQTHPKIAQSGIFEDPTATIQFVSWDSNNPPELRLNEQYKLGNVVVGTFNSSLQLTLREDTRVNDSDHSNEIPTGTMTIDWK